MKVDYLSQKRKPVGQFYGLEAIGFFNSEAEIASSPQQTFSQVRPGDIKYKDQNNDNVIDNNDFKAFGYSTLMPEIYYGLNLGLQWKNLGFKAYFQGTANYSTILNTPGLYMPLGKDSNLSSWYMEDNVRWTQATASEANLPRLSTIENRNNTVNSTLWLADASYFKLRNLYVYYNLPSKWFSKNGKIGMQVYFRGENLFSLDKISYSNPDDVGTYYPDVKSLWCGINFSF